MHLESQVCKKKIAEVSLSLSLLCVICLECAHGARTLGGLDSKLNGCLLFALRSPGARAIIVYTAVPRLRVEYTSSRYLRARVTYLSNNFHVFGCFCLEALFFGEDGHDWFCVCVGVVDAPHGTDLYTDRYPRYLKSACLEEKFGAVFFFGPHKNKQTGKRVQGSAARQRRCRPRGADARARGKARRGGEWMPLCTAMAPPPSPDRPSKLESSFRNQEGANTRYRIKALNEMFPTPLFLLDSSGAQLGVGAMER